MLYFSASMGTDSNQQVFRKTKYELVPMQSTYAWPHHLGLICIQVLLSRSNLTINDLLNFPCHGMLVQMFYLPRNEISSPVLSKVMVWLLISLFSQDCLDDSFWTTSILVTSDAFRTLVQKYAHLYCTKRPVKFDLHLLRMHKCITPSPLSKSRLCAQLHQFPSSIAWGAVSIDRSWAEWSAVFIHTFVVRECTRTATWTKKELTVQSSSDD